MRCQACGQTFYARADAKFCSGRCRVAAHRARQPRLPREMTSRRNWVTHFQKVPRTPFHGFAKSNDPATWSDYATACDAARRTRVDGIGFVFDGTGIAGIDLDDCLRDGVLEDWAADIVAMCGDTYIEVSPSGRGLHIFGKAIVGAGRRLGQIEVYDRGRYFTVTGRRWADAPARLGDISSAIAAATA